MEILRREHHLTTQEAIARSVDLCDRLTHRFARLRDQVMPRASGPLRAYLGHLTHLTPGNLDWGLRADRYRNPDGRHPDAVAMQVQRSLNSDIVMVFDECTGHPATLDQAADSMRLSLRWAQRSRSPPPVSRPSAMRSFSTLAAKASSPTSSTH